MTRDDIFKAGYRQYASYESGSSATFQKKVVDTNGVKYFININEYDFSEFSNYPKSLNPLQYSMEARLYKDNTDFDIVVHVREETLEQAEQLIEKAWTSLGCLHDIHNN